MVNGGAPCHPAAPCLHHVIISCHSKPKTILWWNEWDLLLFLPLLSYFRVILLPSSRECYTQRTTNDWFYLIYFPVLCENENF